jgi:hypothetical protein
MRSCSAKLYIDIFALFLVVRALNHDMKTPKFSGVVCVAVSKFGGHY